MKGHFCKGLAQVIFYLFLPHTQAEAQTSTYDFGLVKVETGPCAQISGLKVFNRGSAVFSECTEAAAYTSVDTISLNDDGIPDLLVCVLMEEYFDIEVKLSYKGTYQSYSLTRVFPADIYAENFKRSEGENFRAVVLRDEDGDGKRDIVTNVLVKRQATRRIPKHSETIKYDEIRKRISQIAKSRG